MSKSWSCELDYDTETTLYIYLFKNVKNVEEIRRNIIKGIWSCTVIKPSLILDPLQIAVAANKAVLAEINHHLVTRSVYAEILFNLSLSKNITESLVTFGIEEDTNLLLCFLMNPDIDHREDIIPKIKGDICSLDELENLADLKKISKVYRLKKTDSKSDMLDIILSEMVTKNNS